MTVRDIFKSVCKDFSNANIDSPRFEAKEIINHFTGENPDLCDREITDSEFEVIERAKNERKDGRPLQYIIGEWEFYSLPFFVGEGVLIPRADTEVLVDTALEILKEHSDASVLDLCSGSGCIAVAVAKNLPKATVFALEKYDEAFCYLEKNIKRNDVGVKAIKGDVFFPDGRKYDLILSNPPYIKSGDISQLQTEVKREPVTALDGDEDGLKFYRAIAEKWIKNLNPNGHIAVEIGIGQEDDVERIFLNAGLEDIKREKDLNGIYRVIVGTYKG